jgi:hypothetical protein
MSNTQSEDKKAEASQQPQQQKPTVLEEDDEFEDFPVDGEELFPDPWVFALFPAISVGGIDNSNDAGASNAWIRRYNREKIADELPYY